MQLTDSTANMMISTLNDPEQPFTPELEKTASSVTGCLTNVLKSAAGSSHSLGSNPTLSRGKGH